MNINKITWVSISDACASFFQMIGKFENNECILSKKKEDEQYTLFTNNKYYYFPTIESAQHWCENYIN